MLEAKQQDKGSVIIPVVSIELDWQIVEEDVPPDEPLPPTPLKPKRRLPRRLLLVLPLIVLLAAASLAAYYAWTYRRQLDQVTEPVRSVARLEAQAVAASDRVSFLALQDPDDPTWRETQDQRYGRLERVGLPEFGWQATGQAPQPGAVSLEPGGARLDVTYQFSVTQPLPGGPTSVTLRVPQYYKQTPLGWVHAMPGVDFWGPWRTSSGQRFAMQYKQRDADVLEPLIPWMDGILARVCGPLPCPPQPIFITFNIYPGSLTRLGSSGLDNGFTLQLPSPHLLGLPADASSRDELYRAIGTRVVQALVYAAAGQPNTDSAAPQAFVRWELAQAGLTGSFITPASTRTLAAESRIGTRWPLSTLALRSSSVEMNSAPREALMPLALAFIEQQVGTGSVTRMIPGIRSSRTLGDLIGKTLGVDPATLEPAWQSYLRQQAGLSPTAGLAPSPPSGELAMSCATDNTGTSSIWRMHTDGTGLTQIIPDVQMVTIISWSPDGRLLAYAHGNYVSIMDWDTERVMTVPVQGFPSWLPNQPGAVSGRLTVADFFSDSPADKRVAHVVDPNTGLDIAITGTYHVWSPDGMQLAYSQADDIIRIADANGFQARQTVQGLAPTWSPDGKRLAYWSSRRLEKMGEYTRTVAADVQVLDVESGAVATLARWDELLPPSQATGQDQGPSGLAWSPDGLSLAVGIAQRNNPPVFILDANTGEVRIRQVGQLVPLPFLRVWSPDSRYLILWVTSNSPSEDNRGELDALDMNTGQTRPLSSAGLWDWSPDGQWLAVAQLSEDKGVWLVTPDLSSIRQLAERMNCVSVAWRPKH